MKKVIVTVMAVVLALSAMGGTCIASDNVEAEVNEVTRVVVTVDNTNSALSEFDKKMNKLLDSKAELLEQYNTESDFIKRLDIADEFIDLAYSQEWFGITTTARFWSESMYIENGLNGWKDGSEVYDSFTGEFLDLTTKSKATSEIFK